MGVSPIFFQHPHFFAGSRAHDSQGEEPLLEPHGMAMTDRCFTQRDIPMQTSNEQFAVSLRRRQQKPTRPGKRLHNYGKSPFFIGKSTINGHFQ